MAESLTLEDLGIGIGKLVFFDMGGTHGNIGMITEIFNSSEGIRSVRIMHPTGRIRVRSLDYDIEHGSLFAVPDVDAEVLIKGCKAWQDFLASR